MGKHYDLTKQPRFIKKIVSFLRKWKLSNYKKRKVRKEKTIIDRDYFVKFKIIINDPANPQISNFEYEMIVPAKAAFIAKKKTKESIKKKMIIEFIECEQMTDKQLEEFEISKKNYYQENLIV